MVSMSSHLILIFFSTNSFGSIFGLLNSFSPPAFIQEEQILFRNVEQKVENEIYCSTEHIWKNTRIVSIFD